MRAALTLAALLTLSPTAALAGGGGGGISLGGGYWPSLRGGPSPGPLGCIGATGFGFSDAGLRVGGEGVACRGNLSSLTYGGAQVGFHRANEWMSWSVHSGVGLGTLSDRGASTGDYRSIFVYLKPTATFGFAWGASGIELGVYALMPLNLVQWVSDGESRGLMNVQPGLQASFLFGRLRQPRYEYTLPATTDDRPAAIPGPSEPPPPPPDQPVEEYPLAIPADEVEGYPAPPPPPQ
jgi:hypothetical protein